MQLVRIQNYGYAELEQITYSQLETSIRRLTKASKYTFIDMEHYMYYQLETMIGFFIAIPHNTYVKINGRTVNELQGLNYNIIEMSARNNINFSNVSLTPMTRNTNLISKLRERTVGEVEGLSYDTIELSERKFNTNIEYKIMKPLKNYKTNLIVIKTYVTNLIINKNHSTKTEV